MRPQSSPDSSLLNDSCERYNCHFEPLLKGKKIIGAACRLAMGGQEQYFRKGQTSNFFIEEGLRCLVIALETPRKERKYIFFLPGKKI